MDSGPMVKAQVVMHVMGYVPNIYIRLDRVRISIGTFDQRHAMNIMPVGYFKPFSCYQRCY